MNSTTQPQISQHPPHTPDSAKAALGNATLLQSFLLPAHSTESKQAHMLKTGQIKPQETQQPQSPQPAEVDEKSELNGIKQQIISLKQEIEKALKEDGHDSPKTA